MSRQVIPSIAFWHRHEFLAARREQIEAGRSEPMPKGFESAELIVMDPGDEIICDSCNAEIPDDGELINLVEFGRRAVCDVCYQRSYAHEDVTYRRLREDGSIGEEVSQEEE